MNKTVCVIEKDEALGGHAETYTDPTSGYTTNLGTVVFPRLKTVTDLFARFEVPLADMPLSETQVQYVDFATGSIVDFFMTPPNPPKSAWSTYLSQLKKYPALQGSFNMTYPVQPDLLLSFGQFVAKYDLQQLVPQVFAANQGYAPLLNITMLYMFKYLNEAEIRSFEDGFLTTARNDTQELYRKVALSFGPNVLLNSTVLMMDRSGQGPVRILVQTPAGHKLVLAKKAVCTVPPLIKDLKGFDLSRDERELFSRFFANGYYTGLLNNTGLSTTLYATGLGEPYNVPKLPGPYAMSMRQNFTQVYYGSPTIIPDEVVKAHILADLRRFKEVNNVTSDKDPDWLMFSSHAPFNLMVSVEDISNGFYERLFSLQGRRNTFYHGAAWDTQDSASLWKFTDDYIIPILLASL
ncbi:hypothetical protein DL769_001150 [Monosporascus sp. CRB-8-3]|nr:hypothetical protein DL769_001150 [Monosporascus sp. CRB-8-3]